ncbi:hypothetical protein B0T18DRAFT_432544 [Schizothecium vesticola]|uniref:Uncharacterized protein n=1 Tax=Schizothecium vesticola TaxID=314040 RepID=A0AA40ELE5_9PEZI|nr:hypothetical protein B0T18DRAFT_432544 [Schizothecium vesticola]
MNYSNMIDEKRMRQGFILATLISTIAGTFTTGINLYDRIVEKRKQAKLDHGQDQRLTDLEARYDKHHGRDGRSSSRSSRSHPDPDLRRSLASGPPPSSANTTPTSRNSARASPRAMSSTVIAVLEEALRTGRPPDVGRLFNASEFARDGSVRALREQYRRMMVEPAPSRAPPRPGMLRRISSTPEMLRIHGAEREGSSVGSSVRGRGLSKDGPLFCAVAVDVQRGEGSLPGGERCLACGAGLGAMCQPWRIEAEVTLQREQRGEVVEVVEVRTYQVGPRFLVKCHREGTGFSCFLCRCHRERDTICEDVPTLVRHLVERHEIGEYLEDGDIREVEGVKRRERSVSVVGEGRRGRSLGRG